MFMNYSVYYTVWTPDLNFNTTPLQGDIYGVY